VCKDSNISQESAPSHIGWTRHGVALDGPSWLWSGQCAGTAV